MKSMYWTLKVMLPDNDYCFVKVVAKNLTGAIDYVRRTGGNPDAIVFASGDEIDVEG